MTKLKSTLGPSCRWTTALLVLLTSGCATGYKKLALNEQDYAGKPVSIINDVPFVEQTAKLCGPTALYMAMKHQKPDLQLAQVTQYTLTPDANGSYKQDMLAAARRLKMSPYLVRTYPQIIDSVASGSPVIIFHRTKFLWKDYWHYSVITGYNKLHESLYAHIGPYQHHEASISDLIGSWEEGGRWAFVVFPPDQIPPNATYQEVLDNSLAFLRLGYTQESQTLSQAMLKKWPERYEGDVILAELFLKQNQKTKAVQSLRVANRKNPSNKALKKKILELSQSMASRL